MSESEELQAWARKLDIDQLFQWSQDNSFPANEKRFLYQAAKKIRDKEFISFKQLQWLKSIHDKKASIFANLKAVNEPSISGKSNLIETKHLCVRLAWHDSAWNGRICKSPEDNVYCVGEHSLLSDRIRRRRNVDIEASSSCAGCVPDMKKMDGYIPPCFWSINAFGKEELEFKHDNPVAQNFPHIKQQLPPYSVVSWPFKLAFVKDANEFREYGNYYPKAIFEQRIRNFQSALNEGVSIVFHYCKFSNPVSGEDMKYLVVGCALLSNKQPMQRFEVSNEELREITRRPNMQNFPTLNWALCYTTDFENSGVRLPYHEYLDLTNCVGGISENYLKEISVTIEEPELKEGFSYVAKHVDDDQAIYLLMKMRRSLLKVKGHDLLGNYDVDSMLTKIDLLLEHTWEKRGYFPGLKALLFSIGELASNYGGDVTKLIDVLDYSDPEVFEILIQAIQQGECEHIPGIEGLLYEIAEFLDLEDISPAHFLRLASVSLTSHQFARLRNKSCGGKSLKGLSENLYLLFEDYEPGELREDSHLGVKVDDYIDLFKVDLAMFPHAKYCQKVKAFHIYKTSDPRRLRAVIIQILRNRESTGDCFVEAEIVQKEIENYPLFYRFSEQYTVKENLSSPSQDVENHLCSKIVFRDLNDLRVYYLKELYDDEQYVEDTIQHLLGSDELNLPVDELCKDLEEERDALKVKIGESFEEKQFIEERVELYSAMVNKKLYVLTGSPGSGKSYQLLKVIQYLNERRELTRVLTLTGKAALRLRKNSEGFEGINASTIDKFLAELRNSKAQGGTTITNNLIIDEASMLDLPKLAELLRLVNIKGSGFKRLILVGDENQLPPIGFGKPFADIIDYLNRNRNKYARNMIYLDTNCRAELPSEFIEFAKAFSGKAKGYESILAKVQTAGGYFSDGLNLEPWGNRHDLYARIDEHTERLIESQNSEIQDVPSLLGIRDGAMNRPAHLDRFQILTPNRTGFFGASGLNLHFQELAPGEFLNGSIGEIVFKLKDKVMHTHNEYRNNELFVSNGSMGAIVGEKKIYFEEHDAAMPSIKLRHKDHLELAYAITVHKSQGSGFSHVFIVLPERSRFISRELFYTALTRTKKKVTIFLQRSDDAKTIENFWNEVRANSAILNRRTTLFYESGEEFAYIPMEGVRVRSRVEYIIYRKLLEAHGKYGGFTFEYEKPYAVEGESFELHPDFVLRFDDGRTIFWEHLGLISKASYLKNWDSRIEIYRMQGDYDSVMTTHELHGISDSKIEHIIESLVENRVETEDSSNRYSGLHLSLR